jgi:phosphoglycerol transferase MdoB-like AlkP superfamily enzyme
MMRPKIMRATKPRFLLLALPLLVVFFGIFRLAFVGYFEGMATLVAPGMIRSLYLGLKFDARLAALLLMPWWLFWRPGMAGARRRGLGSTVLVLSLALYSVMAFIATVDDKAARPWLLTFLAAAAIYTWGFPGHGVAVSISARGIWTAYAALGLGFVLLCYFVDFGAYAYIHTRLNGTLTMFLENAGTSLGMIWESYPVILLLLLILGLMAGFLWLLRRLLGDPAPLSLSPRLCRAANAGITLGLLFIIWGKVSRYPLRWGEAFEAKTTFQAHTALNPVLFFMETLREMDGGYDLDAVKRTHHIMAEYFHTTPATDREGNPSLRRTLPPRPGIAERHPNVVFIQLESFAGFKTGILGNPLDPTPYFDGLCRRGLFFDRTYVAMENTSRSMFATLFGIPDVSSAQNATRNPLLLDQWSPLQTLSEYDKTFYLGGSANWAQIRGILKNNFKDLTLFEEGSWKGPVVDVWGISDRDLLLETHAKLLAKTGPFWAYIQTSGNHPPFTIPSHVKDFTRRRLDAEELRQGGFTGNDEYNSLRFMDHSLKSFFEAAEKAPYFRNTIFVLWADHGIARGSTDKRFGDLTLAIYHIPFLIYAPDLIPEPRRIGTIGTQMDILPTLLVLMGHPVRTQTLGKDLLDPAYVDKGAAFTFTTFRRPPRIGLIQGEWYMNVDPNGKAALFRLDEPDPVDRCAEEPARTALMKNLTTGFHAWGRYLLSHNKPSEMTR